MSYRRALVRRWSRRDRLAVVMVALMVAFLTGSKLLVLTASTQPIGLADPLSSSGTAAVLDADEAPDDELVLPVATATRADGTDVTVVGVPAGAAQSWNVPPPPDDGFVRGEGGADAVRLNGEAGAVDGAVEDRDGRTLLPPEWYVTSPETVAELGTTDTLVLTENEAHAPEIGVPLRSVLGFFLAGQSQLLAVMGAVISGGAVLVAVTVHSVTRMTSATVSRRSGPRVPRGRRPGTFSERSRCVQPLSLPLASRLDTPSA